MDAYKIKKAAFHILLLIALYLLQTDVFTHLRLHSVCPLLLPLAAVGFGLFEGGRSGGLWGLAAGVLCDISVGNGCLFTIYLTFAGFAAGFMSEFILARGFPSFFVMNLIALPVGGLLQIFPLIAFHEAAPLPLIVSLAVQSVYSLLFIVPVYFLVRRAARPRGLV